MIVLRLQKSFFGKEDHALTGKLLAELPGILRWAIEGWQRLHERGSFVQPKTGDTMRQELENLASPIGEFVRERCKVDPGKKVLVSDLYADYKAWAEAGGRERIEDQTGFGRLLRAAVPELDRRQQRVEGVQNPKWFYFGIDLVGVTGCN